MNKKILLVALFMTTIVSTLSAQQSYKVQFDSLGNKMLLGPINEKLLANDSAFMWFFTGVNRYQPDSAWVKYISFYRDSFNVVAFVGTWCPATKRMLPEFYRVMMASSYPMSRIKLYGLDHQLHGIGGQEQTYKVTMTPTFIFLHDGKEIGRIGDKVKRSMESDIVYILQQAFTPGQEDSGGPGAK